MTSDIVSSNKRTRSLYFYQVRVHRIRTPKYCEIERAEVYQHGKIQV